MNRIFCILFALTLASGSALAAATSAFEGTVKDPGGRLMPGAVILVAKDGKIVSKTKTDADGHYVSAPVPSGTYKVDLVINSATIATLANAQTKATGPTELNFFLQNRRFWVQDTGSNIRRYVDPDDPNSLAPTHQLYKTGPDYLQRMQDRTAGTMGH